MNSCSETGGGGVEVGWSSQMTEKIPENINIFGSRYKADLRNMSQQNYEKRRMKLQFEAMRRNDKTHFKEWFLERDFEQEAEERAENLRKESGMKTKGSKANKQKQKDTSELEVQCKERFLVSAKR